MVTYDWETEGDDEGFTLVGNGTINHALSAEGVRGYDQGMTVVYSWELDIFDGYDITQSINAYATMTLSKNNRAYDSEYGPANNALRTVEHRDDVYDTLRFRGEIRQ